MNVLVLGSGGREHAISWKLAQSSQLNELYIAPGNAGTELIGKNVDLDIMDFDAVKAFVIEKHIEIVVVGPEAPLVAGIHDYFIADPELSFSTIIGPKKDGARLEGSKDFSKQFMARNNIPTAKYITVNKDNVADGLTFLDTKVKAPYVLKADGLAGGKGVLIIEDLKEAKDSLKAMLKGKFGKASSKVVIEEYLDGIEVSCFIIMSGRSYKILPAAKDYKRIGDGDTGLNTGGMGAISPVPFANREFIDKVDNQIIIPTIKGLITENIDYSGFLFIGLMNVKNDPYVIEYNVRMGDPETEVVMPRLKSDLLELFEGIATDTLSERDVEFDPRTCATVMMVSGGYPEAYETGKDIYGLSNLDDDTVFHAGTKLVGGRPVTNGGRVLSVTSYGKTIQDAVTRSYDKIESIRYEGAYYRKDIGADLIKTEVKA